MLRESLTGLVTSDQLHEVGGSKAVQTVGQGLGQRSVQGRLGIPAFEDEATVRLENLDPVALGPDHVFKLVPQNELRESQDFAGLARWGVERAGQIERQPKGKIVEDAFVNMDCPTGPPGLPGY